MTRSEEDTCEEEWTMIMTRLTSIICTAHVRVMEMSLSGASAKQLCSLF